MDFFLREKVTAAIVILLPISIHRSEFQWILIVSVNITTYYNICTYIGEWCNFLLLFYLRQCDLSHISKWRFVHLNFYTIKRKNDYKSYVSSGKKRIENFMLTIRHTQFIIDLYNTYIDLYHSFISVKF